MEKASIFKKMDIVLSKIIDGKQDLNFLKYYDSNIYELKEILEKLEKDKFIKRFYVEESAIEEKHYRNIPTIEGRLFLGYEKRKLFEDELINKISRTENDQKTYKNRLLWLLGLPVLLLLYFSFGRFGFGFILFTQIILTGFGKLYQNINLVIAKYINCLYPLYPAGANPTCFLKKLEKCATSS